MWSKNKTYYDDLGVPRTATADEIRKAFRKLARKYHPDVAYNKKWAEERFKIINEAYEVVSDPERRKQDDDLYAAEQKKIKEAEPQIFESQPIFRKPRKNVYEWDQTQPGTDLKARYLKFSRGLSFIIFIALTIFISSWFLLGMWSMTWPSISGKMISIEINRNTKGRITSLDLKYEYEVAGHRYQGSTYSYYHFLRGGTDFSKEITYFWKTHPPGSKVEIHYCPKDHAISCLITGLSVVTFFGSPLLILILWLVLIKNWVGDDADCSSLDSWDFFD